MGKRLSGWPNWHYYADGNTEQTRAHLQRERLRLRDYQRVKRARLRAERGDAAPPPAFERWPDGIARHLAAWLGANLQRSQESVYCLDVLIACERPVLAAALVSAEEFELTSKAFVAYLRAHGYTIRRGALGMKLKGCQIVPRPARFA